MDEITLCPVCKKHTFTEWDEYCPVCNWCHSFFQERNDKRTKCENILSLKEAREAYAKGKEIY